MNYAQYSFNKNYFLFNIDDAKQINPNQQLDHNTVLEDTVVIFPRHIYSGEPFPEPIKKSDPIDSSTVYYTTQSSSGAHPYFTSKFGKYPVCCGKTLCPFGYCNGPQSGRDYMCGNIL